METKYFNIGRYTIGLGVAWTDWMIGVQFIPEQGIILSLLPLFLSIMKEY